jgi:hypothetical protein
MISFGMKVPVWLSCDRKWFGCGKGMNPFAERFLHTQVHRF